MPRVLALTLRARNFVAAVFCSLFNPRGGMRAGGVLERRELLELAVDVQARFCNPRLLVR